MKKIEDLKKALFHLLIDCDDVLSAWEGGSKATGFDDDYSDLDLVVVVNDTQVEETFDAVEKFLELEYGIKRRYRVAEPAWHGFSQCFYQIDQVSAYFYIDLAIIKESIPDKFLAKNRHGLGHVWFDKARIANPYQEDQQTISTRAKRLFQSVSQSDFLIEIEVRKNIKRNRFTEAFPFYYQFLSRHLAVMLNLKYRIDKVDFGLRYAYRDYPKIIYTQIERAMKISTIEEMEHTFEQMMTLYRELKHAFEPLYKD